MKQNYLITIMMFLSAHLFAEKSLTITKIQTPIIIDGQIEDEEWKDFDIISDFVEVDPGENILPSVKTEVRIAYDEKKLYIAFKAFDDPNLVRAHLSKRDDIFSDDMVGIILDTKNEGVVGNTFFSNPFGNQADGQKMSNNENMDWNAIWASAGKLTKDGFEVEMAIPFSSLRFQKSDMYHWRITFFRSVSRSKTRHQISWVPFDRENTCDLCQLGHLYGLKDIGGRAPIELLPSITALKTEESSDANLGIGLKIPIGTNITAELTVNPDFSQIESDQARIDVNKRAALSYSESRPFFNEGVDLFGTGSYGWKPKVRAVYTRSINNPKVAAKIIGQFGKTQFGYLGAQDEDTYLIVPFAEYGSTVGVGESISNIFRIKHSLKPGAYIGGILTDRRYGEGFGQMLGMDGNFRFGDHWNLDWQYFTSSTQELSDSALSNESGLTGGFFDDDQYTTDLDGESFKGNANYFSIERNGRNWGGTMMHVSKSPNFRVDNGYLQLNDQKQISGNIWRQLFPENENIESIFALVGLGRVFNDAGDEWREDWFYASLSGTLKGQNHISFDFMPNSESYVDTTLHNNYFLSFNWNSKMSDKFHFGMGPSLGREIIRDPSNPFQALNKSMNIWMTIKPNEKLSLKPFAAFSQSHHPETAEEIYAVLISRLRLSYQFTASTQFRIVTEYQDYKDNYWDFLNTTFSLQPLLTYQPNPFTIFYIGASFQFENRDTWESVSSQAYLKFQYLFTI